MTPPKLKWYKNKHQYLTNSPVAISLLSSVAALSPYVAAGRDPPKAHWEAPWTRSSVLSLIPLLYPPATTYTWVKYQMNDQIRYSALRVITYHLIIGIMIKATGMEVSRFLKVGQPLFVSLIGVHINKAGASACDVASSNDNTVTWRNFNTTGTTKKWQDLIERFDSNV